MTVAMMTTMAINSRLKSKGSFDSCDDVAVEGGGRMKAADGDWAHSGDGAGACEMAVAVMGLVLRSINAGVVGKMIGTHLKMYKFCLN